MADKNFFHEWDGDIKWINSLDDAFAKKMEEALKKHNLKDAIITGEISIKGHKTAIGVMDTRLMMASMGYVVGEKVTRLFEKATKKRCRWYCFVVRVEQECRRK